MLYCSLQDLRLEIYEVRQPFGLIGQLKAQGTVKKFLPYECEDSPQMMGLM